jgi:hypothetical protein
MYIEAARSSDTSLNQAIRRHILEKEFLVANATFYLNFSEAAYQTFLSNIKKRVKLSLLTGRGGP